MAVDRTEAASRMQDAIAKTREMVEKYATKKGFALNPDRARVEKNVRSMARRQILHGFRYCP